MKHFTSAVTEGRRDDDSGDRARRRRHRRRRRARAAPPTAYHLARHGATRAAAGEDRVPAGEGLRRRADPARGQAADPDGRRHLARGRLAAQQGPAGHRRRRPARAGLARAGQLPRLRPGPHPAGLRRHARPAGGRGRRRAAHRRQRDRPGARRRRPGRSASRPRSARRGAGDLPRAAGRRRRRRLRPVPARAGPGQARGPADGRRRPPLLPLARPSTTTTTWSPGWSCAARRAATSCCPGTAGSSAWATAGSTSASACSTPPRAFGKTNYRRHAHRLAGQHARPSGA